MKKIILISMLALLVLGLPGAVLAETGRWPIHNSSSPNADVLTSAYGPRLKSGNYDIHEGVDIRTDWQSKPVYSWKSGAVEDMGNAGDNGGYWVKVTHPENGWRTGYYHLKYDDLYHNLDIGDPVSQGTVFVNSGNSGCGPGNYHLHFNYLLDSVSDPPNNPGQDVLNNASNPMHILPYSNSWPSPRDGIKYIDSQGYVTAIGFYVDTEGTNLDLDKVRVYNDDTGDKLVVDIGNRVNVYDSEGAKDGEFHATTQHGSNMLIQISPHNFSAGGTQTIGFSFNVEDAWHTQNCRATVEDIQGPEINVQQLTGIEPPNPPTNLHLTAVGSNSVSLAWTAPYGGAEEYHVYYYKEGESSPGIKVTSNTSTTVTGLSQVMYDFAVKSYANGTKSDFSNQVCAAPGHVPYDPTLITAVPRNNKIEMDWTGACGAVNYKLYKSTSPGGGYSYCTTASNTNGTVSGLNNGTQYYFVVTGNNQIGEGPYSNELSATAGEVMVNASSSGPEDGSNSHPYNTISEGINAATSGMTVRVAPGTYYENLSMKTGVDLKRSGAGTVTIRPDGPNPIAIFNGVGNILVENINFRAALGHDAVEVLNCNSGIKFSSCHFYNSDLLAGVYVSGGTSSAKFEKCSFYGNHEGLKVNNSEPTFNYGVQKNNVYSNTYGVYCTNQGIPCLSPNNNFSWPSTNSSYDIRATSSVSGDIHAEQNYWGDGGREPVVRHDGLGIIITSNPLPSPAKIAVDPSLLARAQEKLFSGDRSGALVDFKAIIAAPASQEEALAAVHGVMFASNQSSEEVEAALSYLEGIQRNHKRSEIGAAALYVSISGFVSQGRPGEALSKIDQTLREYPASPYVPYTLLEKALLLDYTYGDEQGAEEVFAQIAATYPDWELTPMVKAKLEARKHLRDVVQEEEEPAVSLSSYPNPANPTTTICLGLPRTARVSVLIYNILGQSVRTLLDDVVLGPGAHEIGWDGKNAAGQELASGIYVCTLKAGKLMRARRIVLLR